MSYKIKAFIISSIIFLFIFLNKSYALETSTVYLTSNKDVFEQGEEIEINLFIENEEVAAFTSYIYFDNTKIEYISGPENTNVVDNRVIYVWYDETGGKSTKSGDLAKFIFKATQNGTTTFTIDGEFYNNAGQLIETNFKENQVQIGKDEKNAESNNALLKSLRLDVEGINPNFNANINEYYLTVGSSVNNIDVLAVAENPNATIEIIGNNDLKDGLNNISINVTSADKTKTNTYTIQVTKTDNVELANTNLEILAIENVLLNPPFYATITNYNVEVSNETDSINVFAVPENENASVQIMGKDDLKEGNNEMTVTVTAQNGFSKKVYRVNVYKRNAEEEIEYVEEQEENEEKLEEIYEAKNMENNNHDVNEDGQEENKSKQKNNEEEKQNFTIAIVTMVIIVILVICLVIYKKKKAND